MVLEPGYNDNGLRDHAGLHGLHNLYAVQVPGARVLRCRTGRRHRTICQKEIKMGLENLILLSVEKSVVHNIIVFIYL